MAKVSTASTAPDARLAPPSSVPCCRRVMVSLYFNHFCLLLIFVNTLGASISCQHRTPASDVFGAVVTGLYVAVVVVKALGSGLRTFLGQSFSCVSLVLVLTAVISDLMRMGDGQYILVVNFFTLFKTFSRFRALEQFRISIQAVMASVSVLTNFSITLFIFIYPTAIMLTVYIGQNSRLADEESDEGTKNKELWGNLPRSMLSLFQIATLDWGDIVRASVMKEPILALIFISFILATGFAVSNVFITVIGEKYSDLRANADEEEDYWERKDEIESADKAKDKIITMVLSGLTTDGVDDDPVDLAAVKQMDFSNAEIASMLIALHQQLVKVPRDQASKQPPSTPPPTITST